MAETKIAPHEARGARAAAHRLVVLCVLDGWGCREPREDNAVSRAATPNFDRLWAECPHTTLRTDGHFVGLPDGQFGNSEVGHLNLGAGRVVTQELPRIDQALEDGSLARSDRFRGFVERARAGTGRVHLLGLLSPGGVHSHQRHMVALATLLTESGLDVALHAFTDGRDTPPDAAAGYAGDVLDALAGQAGITPATIGGRYFAMDRDRRWERTEKAWRALALADAPHAGSWSEAIEASYAADVGDEFIEPHVIGDYAGMQDGDSLLCINFRADRVRQIMGALVDAEFGGFPRERLPRFAVQAGMTSYSAELDERLTVLFPPIAMNDLMGAVVAAHHGRQLRMAETEKYPHVTFFFNGGEERPFPGEERILVPSPKVATYDLKPEMSAIELTDRFVEAVGSGSFDFVLINFANPDMVGHTGKIEAAIEAVETVDRCLGRLVETVREKGGCLLVTADHGNCEMMVDPASGGPYTAHTLNPVPCILAGGPADVTLLEGGCLADVAPTLLRLLGMEQPSAMTGRSLLHAAAGTDMPGAR